MAQTQSSNSTRRGKLHWSSNQARLDRSLKHCNQVSLLALVIEKPEKKKPVDNQSTGEDNDGFTTVVRKGRPRSQGPNQPSSVKSISTNNLFNQLVTTNEPSSQSTVPKVQSTEQTEAGRFWSQLRH